ncbi:MAG: hypothetical protein EA364_08385 [Balneolaceae bacterium]|nr:MAG: hypothetical protein EA364_08385 [Balneolaceae bacterium]
MTIDELTTIEWFEAGIISLAILSLMVISQIISVKTTINKEYTRKLVHFGAGCIVCLFPFVFESLGSVFLLSSVFLVIMAGSKMQHKLDAVHEIGRVSAGAFLYPVAVFIIFWFSGGDWLYFLVPMLLLTISDAAAAIIGKEYGYIQYSVNRQTRSLEGSFNFFMISFVVVLIPVLLSHQVQNESAILLALQLALLITAIESVSVYGIDNLLIPVVGFVGLFYLMPMEPARLITHISILVSAFIILLAVNKWKQLTISGIIGLSLMLYAIYSWGGWHWLIPSVWYCLTFNLGVKLTGFNRRSLTVLSREKSNGLYEISAVFHLSAVPLFVLVLNLVYPAPYYFSLFIALVGVATAISYYQFTPYVLKKYRVSSVPRKSKRSQFFRFAISMMGTSVIYGLAVLSGRELMHSIWSQITVSMAGILLMIFFHRYIIKRYRCMHCDRKVVTPVHCGEDAEPISGYRIIGMWQGVFLTMLLMALLMVAINRMGIV